VVGSARAAGLERRGAEADEASDPAAGAEGRAPVDSKEVG